MAISMAEVGVANMANLMDMQTLFKQMFFLRLIHLKTVQVVERLIYGTRNFVNNVANQCLLIARNAALFYCRMQSFVRSVVKLVLKNGLS